VAPLTEAQVNSVFAVAVDRLAEMLSLDQTTVDEMMATRIQIGDLPAGELGITVNGLITLSSSADGWGWFVDPTPATDASFSIATPAGLAAAPGSAAYGKMDLLTVEMHELAHLVGYDDTSSGLMSENLMAGTRLATPANTRIAQVFDDASGHFIDAGELNQLRALNDQPLNVLNSLNPMNSLNASQLSGWIVRGNVGTASVDLSNHGISTQTPNLLSTKHDQTADSSSGTGSDLEPGTNKGGLIGWDKSFIGFVSSRLRSLV